ncbi:hypothetical protein PMIN06_008982 [Paraphaeosphaeria minitans]
MKQRPSGIDESPREKKRDKSRWHAQVDGKGKHARAAALEAGPTQEFRRWEPALTCGTATPLFLHSSFVLASVHSWDP